MAEPEVAEQPDGTATEAQEPAPIKLVSITSIDGRNLTFNTANVSQLEIEMMLIKALEYVRSD